MSKIEWTDATWNPTRGCRRISPGCENCYAERQAMRMSTKPTEAGGYQGLVQMGKQGARWTGKGYFAAEKLAEPLKWRKPRRVFVNSMSDLFYEDFAFQEIAAVFMVMARASRHTFQVLTKRPARALQFFDWVREDGTRLGQSMAMAVAGHPHGLGVSEEVRQAITGQRWPLPNVWIGVSVEDQQRAQERLPLLLQIPAAVRFVSYEPALEAVDFGAWMDARRRCYDWNEPGTFVAKGCGWQGIPSRGEMCPGCNLPTRPVRPGIDWLIVGGESGHGARPFDLAWARSAVAQCKAAQVPVFVKQMGAKRGECDRCHGRGEVQGTEHMGHRRSGGPLCAVCKGESRPFHDSHGGDMDEWPADLRVREFPRWAH